MASAQVSPNRIFAQPQQNISAFPTNNPMAASPITNSYKLHNTAVEQQAGDYDYLMKNYKGLLDSMNTDPKRGQITPQTSAYNQSSDMTSALANLKSLSQSGGYTPEDLANLRERGISPIRSVYAGANRDVDRQRSLQGGMSPNYMAVKAKMAREQSNQIANQMTDVNAGIAERVAQNKLQIAPQYASSAAGQSNLANEIGIKNADTINDASKFNAGQLTTGNNQQLQALSGAQSLYGTTPALSQLFGQQATQASGLQSNINQNNQALTQQRLNSVMAGLR